MHPDVHLLRGSLITWTFHPDIAMRSGFLLIENRDLSQTEAALAKGQSRRQINAGLTYIAVYVDMGFAIRYDGLGKVEVDASDTVSNVHVIQNPTGWSTVELAQERGGFVFAILPSPDRTSTLIKEHFPGVELRPQ